MDSGEAPPAALSRFNARRAEARKTFRAVVSNAMQRLDRGAQPGEVADEIWLLLEFAGYRVHHQRRQHIERAPQKSRMTKATAERIRRLKRQRPDASLMEIAAAVGVNSGRVSEVLAGVGPYAEP